MHAVSFTPVLPLSFSLQYSCCLSFTPILQLSLSLQYSCCLSHSSTPAVSFIPVPLLCLSLQYYRCFFHFLTPAVSFTPVLPLSPELPTVSFTPVISCLSHSSTLSVSFAPNYLYVFICLCYDLINEECLNGKSIRSSVPPGTGIRLVHTIQGHRLIMAVCFCHLLKSDFSSSRYCTGAYVVTFYKVPERRGHGFLVWLQLSSMP